MENEIEKKIKIEIAKLYYYSSYHKEILKDINDRLLIITPFGGHYGTEGYVFTIEGSPPKGCLFIVTENYEKIKQMYFYDNDKMFLCNMKNVYYSCKSKYLSIYNLINKWLEFPEKANSSNIPKQ